MSDPYTMEVRLCDDAGMVSKKPVDPPNAFDPELTYLKQLNNLRFRTHGMRGGRADPVTEPFACTGSAHQAGEHIRCTSPAHTAGAEARLLRSTLWSRPMPDSPSAKFESADEAHAYVQTDEFKRAFADAQRNVIRADERRRIVDALRHHGHAGEGIGFYEAADFIERRLS